MNWKWEIIKRTRKVSRLYKDRKDRKQLKNKKVTIFSSNCIGGIIYHNLGLQFQSPTINLWISPDDYIEMLKEPKKYFRSGIMKEGKSEGFPVGIINGRKIYGVHYSNFDQLKNKWDRRCQRINWNNICVFMIERDGCTYKNISDFDQLKYSRKVIFTQKKYKGIESDFVLPGTIDDINNNVSDLCGFPNKFSGIRDIDKFDYVSFINGEDRRLS